MISLQEALTEIDNSAQTNIPFAISFVTCDRTQKTGGDVKHFAQAVKAVKAAKPEGVIPSPGTPKNELPNSVNESVKNSAKKNPNHWKNSTRNIRPIDSEKLTKLHIRLITEFNSQRIHY